MFIFYTNRETLKKNDIDNFENKVKKPFFLIK